MRCLSVLIFQKCRTFSSYGSHGLDIGLGFPRSWSRDEILSTSSLRGTLRKHWQRCGEIRQKRQGRQWKVLSSQLLPYTIHLHVIPVERCGTCVFMDSVSIIGLRSCLCSTSCSFSPLFRKKKFSVCSCWHSQFPESFLIMEIWIRYGWGADSVTMCVRGVA